MAKGRKTSGRKEGTPNKISHELRDDIHTYLLEDFEKFKSEMKNLKGIYFTNTYINLCKFVLPALQSVNLAATIDAERTIEDRLADLVEDSDTE